MPGTDKQKFGVSAKVPPAPSAKLDFTGAVCSGCGGVHPDEALDENRWCPECQKRMQRRIRVGQHVIAALIVLPFAVWVLTLEKFDFLPAYAWLLPLAAAYYLGLRIGREALRGYLRWRRVG